MTGKFEKTMEIALEPSLEEPSRLAGKLLISLDEPSESEVEQIWLDEAERRLGEYRRGQVKGIPADEVFRKAIADIS